MVESSRQKSNQALDKKRPDVDPRIKAGALVYIIDQNRTSKLEPANLGPFLVNRQSKRSSSFFLENLSNGLVLERPFPAHHLAFGADTNSVFPITKNDGTQLSPQENKKTILKILRDRVTGDGTSEYLVVWKAKGKANSWLIKYQHPNLRSDPLRQRATARIYTEREQRSALPRRIAIA